MADGISIAIENAGLLRLLQQLPAAIEPRLRQVARETAHRVAGEARRRVAIASGLTHRGIEVEALEKGSGYAVVARRHPMPNVPIFLEAGTVHMEARPFFDVSAQLEEGPHRRRMAEALAEAVDGLGR